MARSRGRGFAEEDAVAQGPQAHWLLIDELNRSLKSPATRSEQGGQSGGGCTLTPVGETIIRLYRDVEEQAQRSCAAQIAELVNLIRS